MVQYIGHILNSSKTSHSSPSRVSYGACVLVFWAALYQRADDVMITAVLRQNDVATSFWRYNDVSITSHGYHGVKEHSHNSHNAPVPHHSEQSSEWCIVGYGAGALWYLWIWKTNGEHKRINHLGLMLPEMSMLCGELNALRRSMWPVSCTCAVAAPWMPILSGIPAMVGCTNSSVIRTRLLVNDTWREKW